MAVSREVPVRNPSGLHARPATVFTETAAEFSARIVIRNLSGNPDKEADGKSVLSVLTLGVEPGHTIEIRAEGEDEEEALRALEELVRSGLGEELVEESSG